MKLGAKNYTTYSRALSWEDTRAPEAGVRVEFAPPPICFNVAVQQPGSSNPSSLFRRRSEGVMRICRASLIFNSLVHLAWSRMVVSSHLMACWVFQECSATADASVSAFLCASLCSFSLVSSLRMVSPM